MSRPLSNRQAKKQNLFTRIPEMESWFSVMQARKEES